MEATLTGFRLRSFTAVALFAAAALAGCGHKDREPAAPARPAAADPVDASIAKYLAKVWPREAGGTVVAARHGKIAHCQGIGLADRERGIAADCDTVYDIMSITKVITATAIIKLEQLGKVLVTDPIGKYVGPVPADKRKITLHHLLTHTSGLADSLGDDYAALSLQDMLDGALKSKLRSAPEAKEAYSNLGFAVLAAILEKASGMSYEAFLAKYLFGPAGMTQTGYRLPRWDPGRVAIEYDRHGRRVGRPFEHPWATDGPYWNLRGNGGLLSTPRDMFRLHAALSGDTILNKRSKEKLFKAHLRQRTPRGAEGVDDLYQGYGWHGWTFASHGRIAAHDGGNDWSAGVYLRSLKDGWMVFWVSNHAHKNGKWNLGRSNWKLTQGITERLLAGD